MAMDVSSLAVQVKSDGISETTRQLEALANAADKVDAALLPIISSNAKLSASQRNVADSSTRATAAANKYIANLRLRAETIGKTRAETEALRATQRGFSSEQIKQATEFGAAIDRQSAAMDAANRRGNILNNTVKSMISAFILYKSIGFARGIIEAGDAWQQMSARLQIVTGSMENANAAQQMLYTTAQSLRAPLEDATRLFVRLTPPMAKLGYTAKDTMEVVKGVGLALALNGSTGAEASSVMLQFSQSMAAGRLNGQELNAVLEGAPPIIRAIEAELDRTGKGFAQTGKAIKQMGAEGALTPALITEALKRATPEWQSQFDKLPVTVDNALTRIKNAWQKAIGEMSKDTGLNASISEGLQKVIDIIPGVANAMGEALAFVTNNIKGLSFAIGTLLAFKLASFFTTAAVQAIALTGATTAATGAVTAFGAALKLSLGWIGLIVTALAALYTAYKLWGDNATKDSEKVTAQVIPDTEARILAIKKETEAINERYAASSKKTATQDANTNAIDETVIANNQVILRLKEAQAKATDAGSKQAFAIAIQEKQALNDKLVGTLAVNKAVKDADMLRRKSEEESTAYNEYRKKYDKEYQREQALKAAAEKLSGDKLIAVQKMINAQYDKASISKANTATKHQTKAVDDLNAALMEQEELQSRISAFGSDYDKLGEGTKKRISLERQLNGELTNKERLYLNEQLNLAKILEKSEALTESMKKQAKATDELNKARSVQAADLKIIQDNYDAQLRNMTLGDKAVKHQEEIFAINKKYSEQRQRLDEDNAKSAIPNYSERLSLINQGNQQELALYESYYRNLSDMQGDWEVGFQKAWANYQDSATNAAAVSERSFSNIFQSMEDALLEFVTTGKLNFKSLATSILKELATIAIKAAASGLFQMLGTAVTGFFGGGAGAAGGAAGGAMAGGGATMLAANGAVFSSGSSVTKFANGGSFTGGIVSKPTNFNIGQMGEAGPEAIVPLTKTSDGSLGVKQVSSGGEANINLTQVFNIEAGNGGNNTDMANIANSGKDFQRIMEQTARNEIEKQKQQGGSLWKMVNGRK